MKVYKSIEEAAGMIPRAVVTTGSFDGVHIGHKLIIDSLNRMARDEQGESVLITFHPHPRKVLYPDQKDLRLINSQQEKIELLRKAGLDNLIIQPFTLEFSRTSSHDFVANMLIGQLKARIVVVGHNHHFGYNRQGDYSYLHGLAEEMNFRVTEIPLKDIENETVSSTKIRRALLEGNIQRANAYLDHQYIIHAKMINKALPHPIPGVKTLNSEILDEEKLIPPAGLYATNLVADNNYMKSLSLISLQTDGTMRCDTVLLYDDIGEMLNRPATLYFYKKVMDLPSVNGERIDKTVYNEAVERVEDLIY